VPEYGRPALGSFLVKQYYTTLASPAGFLKLVATDNGLVAVLWEDDDPKRVRLGDLNQNPEHPILKKAVEQLREYFWGTRDAFDFEIDLDVVGTDFQKSVWRALLDIPFRETKSYAEIASAVGRPDAVRAVGGTIGRNPLSIVAPCHRVIGSAGSLTGFAGGMAAKLYLLTHENAPCARSGEVSTQASASLAPAAA
jgi:methylated-DNA-[protein]-cysteine S-methyltransferase